MNYYVNQNNYLSDLFDSLLETKGHGKVLSTDIIEDDNKYELIIDIPGYSKENVKLSYEDEYLTVIASIPEKKDEKIKYISRERYTGTARRSYYIGKVSQDAIHASFNDGVLTITINKELAKKEERKFIEIN